MATKRPPLAYSYLRFSTPEQAQGDSFRRQEALAEGYAARRGLVLDDGLRFEDRGVSGFRGANARSGALGEFLRAIDDGDVAPGSFLLIENLDRVSRQDPWEALPIFQQIINAGITIVTLQDGKEWNREEMRSNAFRIMESIIAMMRANEESATKSRRVRAAWANKRANAATTKLTARCPAWLELKSDRSGFKVLRDRAAIVKRVYAETLGGDGQHRIAERLNREGVPTFGRGAYWQRSYIKKLLESPSVVGIYVPHETEHVDGRRMRRPGTPVAGYYPAVVARETYDRVQSMRIGAKTPAVKNVSGSVSHLLAGLARCPRCGSTMTRVNKGSGPKGGHPYLVCVRAKAGDGCEYRGVRVDELDGALIGHIKADRLRVPSLKESNLLEMESFYAGQRDATDRAIEGWLKVLEEGGPSRAVQGELRKEEAKREELTQALIAVSNRIVAAGGLSQDRRLEELAAAVKHTTVSYTRPNAIMRQLFASVVVQWETGVVVLEWTRGGTTTLAYTPDADKVVDHRRSA